MHRRAPCWLIVFLFGILSIIPAFGQFRQVISFSGFDWNVRISDEATGPMNNVFGRSGISVEKLEDGALRLSVSRYEGIWYAAEVSTRKYLGYGTYTFRVRTPVSRLHPDIILGLFTYSQARAYANREIDIEFSAWGGPPSKLKGQFVVQPYTKPENIYYFPVHSIDGPASFQFTWLADRIEFSAWRGYGPKPTENSPDFVSNWVFSNAQSIPKPSANVHMNLYLNNGEAPRDISGSLEIIIDRFEFTPAK